MSTPTEWANRSGDVWAKRWRHTDRALSGLAPALQSAIVDAAAEGPCRALEIGCGSGATTEQFALARPDIAVVACDLSPALIEVARKRLRKIESVDLIVGDALTVAQEYGPFDLLFSRHGVMFFPDPVEGFRTLRNVASGSASIVFSCFRDWTTNEWASELASAAAGRSLPSPGRAPGGFAFAEEPYVRELLADAGWARVECWPVSFRYVAGEGEEAVEQALSFLLEIGPASSTVRALPPEATADATERMREVIQSHFDGSEVAFPASAWIWSAQAEGPL